MPHHTHTHTHTGHELKVTIQNPLNAKFLEHLHDTELWASHIPRVPMGLYVLAVIGLALGAASLTPFLPDSALLRFSTLTLGALLLLPALFARHFAHRKWAYASRIRKDIFDSLALRGDEKILDVGCGAGLLVNEAARRLTSGKAIGIDIWAPHSGGGNYALLMKNAQAEGVADKIEFKQADVRKLPFEDASFDVIVSSGALHHISRDRSDHEQAINEMLRVLKPGGRIALMDISHMIEGYASNMKTKGVISNVQKTVQSPFGFEMSVMIGRKDA
ncbi:MAG TPA: class I SAM-dependent methyltransferase [Anaerolineales bacterium]|nr:class I SAM-dependent methyltransferase [Anaerolineales bacterium]